MVVLALFSRSAEEGADTIVFCAAGSGQVMDTIRGKFIRDRRVEESVEQILNAKDGEGVKLWEMSEQLVKNITSRFRET